MARAAQNLVDVFRGEQCIMGEEIQDLLSCYAVAAAGASDWAKQSLVCGTFKAAFKIMGLDVDAESLANGCPSLGTIANWEFRLAAGSLASVIHDIKKDAERLKEVDMPLHISLITDHGNRKGVDHLVKVIMWSSIDAKGNRVIRRFNLDIDAGEHTAVGAAEAIKRSLSVLGLEEERDNLRFSHLHGDRGGGGAVQSIFPELQSLEVLHILATWTNCMLHALQKALETASIRTFGRTALTYIIAHS
eukprot:scaffold99548_cov20-Cyclotella_meneghiniana.AAC.1